MKQLVNLLRVATAAILILFLVIAPGVLSDAMRREHYRDWLSGEPADWGGVLTLWHVVEFRTYQGSVTGYLESCAAQLEKQYDGVYVEVIGLNPETLAERYTRGERPDIWSFPVGLFTAEQFGRLSPADVAEAFAEEEKDAAIVAEADWVSAIPLAGNLAPLYARTGEAAGEAVALPYLLSGYYLIGNTQLLQEWELMFPDQGVAERMQAGDYEPLRALLQDAAESRATARYGAIAAAPLAAARLGLECTLASDGDFKAGQVPFYIGDARACGDIARKMATGGFTFEAIPVGGFNEQVQYIAMDAAAAGKRAAYAERFIRLLMGEEAQKKLSALGAAPAVELPEAPIYGDSGLQRFYEAYQMPLCPRPDIYAQRRQELYAAAESAMGGERGAFTELLEECL